MEPNANLGIKNDVQSRIQSVCPIAPRSYLLSSPGYGYPGFGCLPWNGEMTIGSSFCFGYTRSNSLPWFLLGLLGYARSNYPLRDRRLSARSNGLPEMR